MNPLLLIGCGGHARSLIELIESTSSGRFTDWLACRRRLVAVFWVAGDWL